MFKCLKITVCGIYEAVPVMVTYTEYIIFVNTKISYWLQKCKYYALENTASTLSQKKYYNFL